MTTLNCRPVNIPNTSKNISKCATTCEYKFDFSNTSALKYVYNGSQDNIKINIDNISDRIKFKGISLATAYFKIYRKSYHLFDGRQVDAELEIRQCGKNNTVLYTYIPIIKHDNGAGITFDFFNTFLSQIQSNIGGNTSGDIKVGSDWTLNDVIPNTNYYYYQYDIKHNTIHNIVFGLENAAKISNGDFDYLTKIISNPKIYSEDQKDRAKKKSNCTLYQSATNAKGPSYNAQYILSQCKEISGVNNEDNEKKNEPSSSILTTFTVLMGILIGIIILYFIWKIWSSIFTGPQNEN